MPKKLVIVGNTSRDTVKYNDTERGTFWGGGGLNVAMAASYAGEIPKLVSVVGESDRGFVERIGQYIDVSWVKLHNGPTCRFVLEYSQDGILNAVNCDFGVSPIITEHFLSLPVLPAHYHICCRTPLDSAAVLLRLVEKGCSFSIDFMASSMPKQLETIRALVPRADCIFANESEYSILQQVIDKALIKMAVVTSGSRPISLLEYGKLVIEEFCPPAEFLDVTGAGDIIVGTFLANNIAGENLSVSIKRARENAQASLKGLGIWSLLGSN